MGECLATNMINEEIFLIFFSDFGQMMLKLGRNITKGRTLVKFEKFDGVISNSKV